MGLLSSSPLKGKVAIVTGGTMGIGLGIADKLASLGAKVVVAAIDNAKTKHHFIQCDVSDMNQVKAMVAETMKKFKRIDILVNNAGIFPSKLFTEMTEEDWKKVMQVNLNGTFNCSKIVSEFMIQQKSGKIINLASIAAFVGFQGLVHYCTAKAGVTGFTRALALELGPHNINVNAIAPGLIITPGVNDFMNQEQQAGFAQSVPLKRNGLPKDIAELAAFLATDASSFITGQTIVCDGGKLLE
ncbi:SDR family oxidoreductase [Candidatus Woesearchaeota archaeon]|nr:SDR family oxidoreductase [Candidatus Woesearchaeota archaeon]